MSRVSLPLKGDETRRSLVTSCVSNICVSIIPKMESQVESTTTSSAVVVNGATEQARTISQINMTPDRQSSYSVIFCRICHEDSSTEELIHICNCTGTQGLIHASCVEKWLSATNTDHCEICKYAYVIEKRIKPLSQSFWLWWNSKSIYGQQRVVSDVTRFIILTPLCLAAAYLCALGAIFYSHIEFWKDTCLAVLCCMIVITYFLWLIITIRFHFLCLMQWRKRNPDVKLIVKHQSKAALISTHWIANNDRSNDSPNNSNLCAACFLTTFGNNDDSLYSTQQLTTFV